MKANGKTGTGSANVAVRGSMLLHAGVLLLLCCAGGAPAPAAGRVEPVDLRCEYLVNPLGIDTPQPRLFWKLASPDRGARQTARHLLVASSEELLRRGEGDLWDSGKVASDQAVFVLYAGRRLMSRQRCYWKVRVWDQNGRVFGLERAGVLDDGPVGRTRLAGTMDCLGSGADGLPEDAAGPGYFCATDYVIMHFYPKEFDLTKPLFRGAKADTQIEVLEEVAADYLRTDEGFYARSADPLRQFFGRRPKGQPFFLDLCFNVPHTGGTSHMEQRPTDDVLYRTAYRACLAEMPLPMTADLRGRTVPSAGNRRCSPHFVFGHNRSRIGLSSGLS
jgi:hypothetical protein